jgi:NCS2 family nucleobase:cation symporter-2
VAVPLIVGRALKLSPEQVAMLISADLFCCGLVTLIQSLGFGRWFGIKLPVMMGVTFAAVGPMVAMANVQGGPEGARAIFGAIIGAGIISIAIAPLMSRLLRFFPPVVTGTIIAIIGISLMRVGIGWAMGGPAPQAQSVDVPKLVAMVDKARADAAAAATLPPDAKAPEIKLPGPVPMKDNPNYGALDNMGVAAFVLVAILLMVRYAKGFVANIAVLLGIIIGWRGGGAGQDELRQGRQGAVVGRGHALRLRHAQLRPADDPDDDAGDDRRDDRIDGHVPGAPRSPGASSTAALSRACAPTAWAP